MSKPFPHKRIVLGCSLVSSIFVLFFACSSDPSNGDPPVDSDATGDGDSLGDDDAAGDGDAAGGGTGQGETPDWGGGSGDGDDSTGGTAGNEDTIFAHVRAVATSGSAENYTFNVSVESADIDCSQFANWWEVLSENGELLYRRIIDHSHTDENGTSDAGAPGNTYTRSGGPVDIAENELVYVRAHMNTGGYNGDILVGSVESGFKVATHLASDFAAAVEFQEPQTDRCDF